jgi:tetratricopeptide (TPR) repeat protein
MIYCSKCKTKNEVGEKICKQCGANLLPKEGLADRIGNLIVGVVGGVLCGLVAYNLFNNPELAESFTVCPTNPVTWLIVAIVFPITNLALALRKTPEYLRYAIRARRHIELDPEQAIEDFSQALELAPQKERASILNERASLYKKLGREKEETRDRLAYTYAEEACSGGAGLAGMFGGDKDAYVSTRAMDERKKMMAEGKITALGYCPKCARVVELNEKLRCPQHKSPKPKNMKFVVPADAEKAVKEIEEEYAQQSKKTRGMRKKVIVIISIIAVLCVVCSVVSYLTQK